MPRWPQLSIPLPGVAWRWLTGAGLAVAAAGCTTPQIAGPLGTNPASHSPQAYANYAANTPTPAADPVAATQNNGQLHLAYGQLQEQRGQMAEARASYEKALQVNPQLIEAHVSLARLDLAANRPADAERRLKEALRLQPRSAFALSALGQLYGDQRRWDDALHCYLQAMNNSPDDKRYTFQLAVALAKSGRVEQSVPVFARAVGEAAAHHNVAVILLEQGDRAAAEHHAQLALRKDPQLPQAQEMLALLRGEAVQPAEKQLAATASAATTGPAIRPGQSASASAMTPRNTVLPTAASSGPHPSHNASPPSGALRITPGRAPTTTESSAVTTRWSQPLPFTERPASADEQWQRMPVAPRTYDPAAAHPAAPAAAPSAGNQQWEQWQNQRGDGTLN